MKIDMAKATTEWLEEWKAAKTATPQGSFYLRIPITEVEAKRQYVGDKLDIYISDFQVGPREVTFYKSDIFRDDLKKLMRVEFILEGGTAVLDEIDSQSYHEPYCEDPSNRLEITFRIPK